MKVLLDECLDPRYSGLFARHECTSVKSMGWLGKANGELLTAASAAFDAFVTIDRHLPFQQNLTKVDLIMVVIRESRNDPAKAEQMVGLVETLLDSGPKLGVHWIELT